MEGQEGDAATALKARVQGVYPAGHAGENAGFAEASPITEETASTRVQRFATAVKGTSSAAVRGSSSPDGATSYANAVKGLVSAENGEKGLTGNTFTPRDLSYIKPVIENGRVKVMPPSEVAAVGCEEWQKTLIWLGFPGQKKNFPVVNSIALRIWGKSGADEVLSSENGFIFFCYDSLNSVLERAPWHMANRPLVIKRWQPNLTLSKEDLKRVPCWVKLYNVPLEFWTPMAALSYLSSALGNLWA
ncbi:hypothetical protein LINPERPRIM_LOCUS44929 [Linum perenne]